MHPRQLPAVNAPQTFPLNVHRLGPLAQFLPGPPWGAVSKASRSSRLNTRCKVDAAGVLLPIETQPGSQIAMLPAPLVNRVEAMAVGNMAQTAKVRVAGKLWRLPEGLRESGTCSKACASLDPKFSILSSTSSRYSPSPRIERPCPQLYKSGCRARPCAAFARQRRGPAFAAYSGEVHSEVRRGRHAIIGP